jgi:hypothetical protein
VGKKRVGEPLSTAGAGTGTPGAAGAREGPASIYTPPLRGDCTTADGTLEGAGEGCDMTPCIRGREAGRLSLNLSGVLRFLRKRSEGMVNVRDVIGTMRCWRRSTRRTMSLKYCPWCCWGKKKKFAKERKSRLI